MTAPYFSYFSAMVWNWWPNVDIQVNFCSSVLREWISPPRRARCYVRAHPQATIQVVARASYATSYHKTSPRSHRIVEGQYRLELHLVLHNHATEEQKAEKTCYVSKHDSEYLHWLTLTWLLRNTFVNTIMLGHFVEEGEHSWVSQVLESRAHIKWEWMAGVCGGNRGCNNWWKWGHEVGGDCQLENIVAARSAAGEIT